MPILGMHNVRRKGICPGGSSGQEIVQGERRTVRVLRGLRGLLLSVEAGHWLEFVPRVQCVHLRPLQPRTVQAGSVDQLFDMQTVRAAQGAERIGGQRRGDGRVSTPAAVCTLNNWCE